MSRSAQLMAPTKTMTLTLCLLWLLVGSALATEVLINSGGNGESTSQANLITPAAAASETVKVTTEAVSTTTTSAAAPPAAASKTEGVDTVDLDKAETKDPTKKLEIIKQIRKINKDGSYTVGYEAGDGTFKIESRDVLGNIKGTYGYVDSNGEIKRVSYNGNNGTSALKNFPAEIGGGGGEGGEELSTTLPNVNAVAPAAPQRTSLRSMRRPQSLKFLSTTPAPSVSFGPKSNYIQSIPKRRLGVPSSTERSQYSHYATDRPNSSRNDVVPSSRASPPTTANPNSDSDEQPTPTTIVYARTVPTQKPLIILRPTTQATSTSHTQEQISRPDKLEINHVSKVMVMKSSETSTSKSVHVAAAEKEHDRKSIRGNNLRRQLAQEREDHYEAQPQQLYAHNAGEDSQHLFDGATGNLRPLYSTTSRPRVPSIVLAARQRAAQLQNALNSNSAPTTTTEKVYVRPPPPPAAIQYETTTSEPAQEINYLTQSPSGTVVQIPANQGISQQASEDQGSIYGQRPAPFSLRQQQQHQPQGGGGGGFQGTEPPNSLFRFPPPPSARGDQFLRETTPSSSKHHREDVDEPLAYGRNTQQQQQRPRGGVGAGYDGEANYQQGSYPIPYQQQNPYGYFPGQAAPFNFPQRPPVTTRDFEMLLQLLQYRHRVGGGGGGAGLGATGYGGYNPYNPNVGPYLSSPYQGLQQYPRSPLYDPVGFDPRYGFSNSNNFGGFRQYSEPQNSIYPSGQAVASGGGGGVGAIDSPQQQPQYNDQRGIIRPQRPFTASNSNYYGANSAPAINPYQQQQQVPRGGGGAAAAVAPYYQPDFSNVQQSYATQASTQQDYLPSEVREDLLYRMLMLAIQNPFGGSGGAAGGSSLGMGYESNHLQQQQQSPHSLGAFSDPIKSVIHTATGESAAAGSGHISAALHHSNAAPPLPHNHQQQQQHHRSTNNLVQTATRKPVRSVQIIGEAEE